MTINNQKSPQDIIPGGFGEKEDIIQKSIQTETRFFKGLAKQRYDKVWMFALAYLSGLFILFVGIVGLGICLTGLIEAVKYNDIVGHIPTIIMFLLAGAVCFAGLRVLIYLVKIYKTKDKKYKFQVVLLLTVPTLLFVFLLVALVLTIPSINFSFSQQKQPTFFCLLSQFPRG